ncbi:hypothetical protein SeLEV6574_g07543 [Synchytrium endobioticum]|uniref:Peptidase A1 domain-containing protein n=1 Tax=Synchytrium endobioticum TaxID=286115 RepID=A0A507CLF3_9FUNG|nr:hypothetical protein SeLEV6574_g07543 [Synchytrium endobioticum]
MGEYARLWPLALTEDADTVQTRRPSIHPFHPFHRRLRLLIRFWSWALAWEPESEPRSARRKEGLPTGCKEESLAATQIQHSSESEAPKLDTLSSLGAVSAKLYTFQFKVNDRREPPASSKFISRVVGVSNLSEISDTVVALAYIGSPPQGPYTILLDTGSDLFWVRGSNCSSTTTCAPGSSSFDHNKSSTYQAAAAPYHVSSQYAYGDGTTITFTGGFDTVSISGMTVPNQYFGEAQTYYSPVAFTDGLIGLPPPCSSGSSCSTGNFAGAPSSHRFLTNAVSQGILTESVFAFWYNSSDSGAGTAATFSSFSGSYGEVSMGGMDSAKYTGSVTWLPLLTSLSLSYWVVSWDYIQYGENTTNLLPARATYAVVDTGSTSFGVPATAYNKIMSSLGTVSCSASSINALSDLHFGMGGQRLTLSPSAYIDGTPTGGCSFFGSSVASDTNGIYIAGADFQRKFYTVYDYGNSRVGFAASSSGPAGTFLPSNSTSNSTRGGPSSNPGSSPSAAPSTSPSASVGSGTGGIPGPDNGTSGITVPYYALVAVVLGLVILAGWGYVFYARRRKHQPTYSSGSAPAMVIVRPKHPSASGAGSRPLNHVTASSGSTQPMVIVGPPPGFVTQIAAYSAPPLYQPTEVPPPATPKPRPVVPPPATPPPRMDVPAPATPKPRPVVPPPATPPPRMDVPAPATPEPRPEVPPSATPQPQMDVPAPATPEPRPEVPPPATPEPQTKVPLPATPNSQMGMPSVLTSIRQNSIGRTSLPPPAKPVAAAGDAAAGPQVTLPLAEAHNKRISF